jgi:predicted AlkP superfamily pyrophosphatase or phosphodiesterase
VDVVSFVRSSLARTVYSRLSHRGSEVVPFITASDLMASLRKRLNEARRRTLFYVYWESVDTLGHVYGPGAEPSISEVSLLDHVLKTELLDRVSRRIASETLLMLTADHGQTAVEPEEATYLNGMKPVMNSLEVSPAGKRIPPWGSSRDVYLSVRAESLERVIRFLTRKLGESALVLRTADAVERGLFGLNSPKRKFLERVGNLMILPRKNSLVWYRYSRGDALDVRGHHGGLTPAEMLIPFVSARISDLRTRT